MKVLIQSHTPTENQDWWYATLIGEIFEVKELENGFYSVINDIRYLNIIQKQDCHVIQPAWQVMKEAEETGRRAEVWFSGEHKWGDKASMWYSNLIYRLKSEPKTPVLAPLEGEELAELVGRVILLKGTKVRHLVTDFYDGDNTVKINGNWRDAEELLENFTLDGSPIGKETKP